MFGHNDYKQIVKYFYDILKTVKYPEEVRKRVEQLKKEKIDREIKNTGTEN